MKHFTPEELYEDLDEKAKNASAAERAGLLAELYRRIDAWDSERTKARLR